MTTSQAPLKIGILLRNRHDGPGGLEKVLEVLALGMSKRNIDLYFYGLFPPSYTDFTRGFQKIEYLKLPVILERIEQVLPKKLARIVRKKYVKSSGYKLFDQMIEDKLDVLITMDLSSQFLSNYKFLRYFKERSNIPVLSWVHVSLTGSKDRVASQVVGKINIFDGHLAISQGLAEELETIYNARNISLVYNPIDMTLILPRDKKKFIYIGRMTKIKRVESLLKQLAEISGEWTLDIYGSTGKASSDNEFERYINTLGLQNKVVFHGWKSNAWESVESAGVLLLNSTREGFGLVIVEAMMRGIPVISADCPVGPSELIQHGKNGWLYPVDEECQIKIYLQKILDGELILPDSLAIQQSVQVYETTNYLDNFVLCITKLKNPII